MSLFAPPYMTIQDEDGNPVSGGKLFFYATETSTPASVYADGGLTTPLTNPVVADSAGRCAAVYLDPTVIYRCKVTTAAGATIRDVDPIDNPLSALGASDGSSLVTFIQAGTGAVARTAQSKMRGTLAISDFSGADPTGATDSAAAINSAITAAQTTGQPIHVDGVYLHNSQIVVPDKVRFVGYGALVSDPSLRSKSCFVKNFNGVGFLFSGDESGTEGVQYDSAAAKTGDNVQVTGMRWNAPSICVTNSGADNLRIGKTEAGASSINANAWFIGLLHSYGAVGCGMRIDHTNTDTSATFPLGAPDCGVGTLVSADFRVNGSHGLSVGNSIDNWFGNIIAQNNSGHGTHFGDGAWSNVVHKLYSEANADDVILDAGAIQNSIDHAARAGSLEVSVTDNSGNRSNKVNGRNSSIGEAASYKTAPEYYGADFNQYLPDLSAPVFRQYVTANLVPAGFKTEGDGASGTKMTWFTRTTGFGISDKLTLDNGGWLDVLTAGKGLKVAGTQVVTDRQTGWTAATGTALKTAYATYAGATHTGAYVQATVQALDDAAKNASQRIKALEDALRTHGLID